MADLSDKLSSILSDPAAMQEIAALASQLGMEAPGVHKEPPPAPDSGADTAALLSGLMPVLSSMKADDDTTRLLEAMRPFLSEERRAKLDRAKRLIRLMKLMPMIKDLPLLDL